MERKMLALAGLFIPREKDAHAESHLSEAYKKEKKIRLCLKRPLLPVAYNINDLRG